MAEDIVPRLERLASGLATTVSSSSRAALSTVNCWVEELVEARGMVQGKGGCKMEGISKPKAILVCNRAAGS